MNKKKAKKKNKNVYSKKFSTKGFVFLMEAIITILLFSLILISFPVPKNNSLKELIILQQENDLLKVWSKKYPTESEIITDTKQFFENASVFINEKEFAIGKKCLKKSISNQTIIYDDNLSEQKIRIVVYECNN